mmetsp:Transcript_18245/g.44537  ORF Transcript_18245/g.44537 Transcript_18245/m.44537 type:complete len:446 (-) Transcript_18245:113-1450(-)
MWSPFGNWSGRYCCGQPEPEPSEVPLFPAVEEQRLTQSPALRELRRESLSASACGPLPSILAGKYRLAEGAPLCLQNAAHVVSSDGTQRGYARWAEPCGESKDATCGCEQCSECASLGRERKVLEFLQENSDASQSSGISELIDCYVEGYFTRYVVLADRSQFSPLEYILEDRLLCEAEAATVFSQLCSVLDFLKQNNVLHRSWSTGSVLIDRGTARVRGAWRAQVTNFEEAVRTDSGAELGYVDQPKGDPEYWAPEAHDQYYGFMSEVWSVGVVLYQSLRGTSPFVGTQDQLRVLVNEQASGDKDLLGIHPEFKFLSPLCRTLLERIFIDQSKRATASELLQDPWTTILRSTGFQTCDYSTLVSKSQAYEDMLQFDSTPVIAQEFLEALRKLDLMAKKAAEDKQNNEEEDSDAEEPNARARAQDPPQEPSSPTATGPVSTMPGI